MSVLRALVYGVLGGVLYLVVLGTLSSAASYFKARADYYTWLLKERGK